MTTPAISEPDFILTELRYTSGQLRVQASGIPEAGLAIPGDAARGIAQVLDEMLAGEGTFRARCKAIIGVDTPMPATETGVPSIERFIAERENIVGILAAQPQPWPAPLLETTREQIVQDRERVTRIANYRRAMFEDTQPDPLHQPLNPQG